MVANAAGYCPITAMYHSGYAETGVSIRGMSTRLPRMQPNTATVAVQWLKPTISKADRDRCKKRKMKIRGMARTRSMIMTVTGSIKISNRIPDSQMISCYKVNRAFW